MNEIKLKGAIYLRADAKAEDAKDNIERQERVCRDYCELTDIDVSDRHVYRDIASGKSPVAERPGLQALIDAVRREELDIVVVRRMDRLARDTGLFLKLYDEFELYKVRFVSTTEPVDTTQTSGKMLMRMLASFSAFETARAGNYCVLNGCHNE